MREDKGVEKYENWCDPGKFSERKRRDTEKLKEINSITKRKMTEVLPKLDESLIAAALQRTVVYDYIMDHGTNAELLEMMRKYR